MQGMVASRKKKKRKAKTKMGERHHRSICLVRWQQQAEWWRTVINFAETSGQRRPDEDMLREDVLRRNVDLNYSSLKHWCSLIKL